MNTFPFINDKRLIIFPPRTWGFYILRSRLYLHVVKVAVTGWLRPWSLRATRLTVYSSPGLRPVCTKEVMVLGSCAVIPPSLSCQQSDTKAMHEKTMQPRPRYCIFSTSHCCWALTCTRWPHQLGTSPCEHNHLGCVCDSFFKTVFHSLKDSLWEGSYSGEMLDCPPVICLWLHSAGAHCNFQKACHSSTWSLRYTLLSLQSYYCTCASWQQMDIKACAKILKLPC